MTAIHPYWTRMARKTLDRLSADPDADTTPLAVWAQKHRDDRTAIAIITRDGTIVGHAIHGRRSTGADYADRETTREYRLKDGNELGLALVSIGRQLGQRVVAVRIGMLDPTLCPQSAIRDHATDNTI